MGARFARPLRWWVRRVAAIVLAFAILLSGFVVVALIEPDDGPGSQIVGFAEDQIRQNDELHYNIHRTLGKIFSFCPCTLTISQSQYQKAFYHRPRPAPQP